MHLYRPILTQHRLQRLVLWALTMLHWIAAMLSGGGRSSARHVNQRGDVSLGGLTRMITALLMIRAAHIVGRPRRPVHYWRFGRRLRCEHFRRSLLGSKLRRVLKHKHAATHIAQLIAILRDFDEHAAYLAQRIRLMRRYFLRTTPSIAPADLFLGAPALPPAFSDSS
jgi:hypothetical protein